MRLKSRGWLRILAPIVFSSILLFFTSSYKAVYAGDQPSGFWYGADGSAPTASGSSVPYQEPYVDGGGTFGVYIYEIGSWWQYLNCGSSHLAQNSTDFTDANSDYDSGYGVGTGAYYYMAGPGLDPNYNGSTQEAYTWGQDQAEFAYQQYLNINSSTAFTFPIIFMDIEPYEPQKPNQYTNGWDAVGNCNGAQQIGISPSVDRATFNGFWDYIRSQNLWVGVYSGLESWDYIFETTNNYCVSGDACYIPHTWEWTYEDINVSSTWPYSLYAFSQPNTSNPAEDNNGDDEAAGGAYEADFFGGQTSTSVCVLMWQWSQGNPYNGKGNGVGDFDTVDQNNWNNYNGSNCY